MDADYTYVQVALRRVRWLKPFPYEINVDEASAAITALLENKIDKDATSFGNYEEAKSRLTINLQIASMIRKKNKLVKKLKERFGEGDDEEEEEDQSQAPLQLTQGLGEDRKEDVEGVEGEEVEEAPKEENKTRKEKE